MMRRGFFLIIVCFLILLTACRHSAAIETPPLSFDTFPLGAAAEELLPALGISQAYEGDGLYGLMGDELAASPYGIQLAGVSVDHIGLMATDGVLQYFCYDFYATQFENPEAFFTAIVQWHADLDKALTEQGFLRVSKNMDQVKSAADYAGSSKQYTTRWMKDDLVMDFSLSGKTADSAQCKVLLRDGYQITERDREMAAAQRQ